MTNAPADLLALRSKVLSLTGLTDPASVGIVGDSAHAASGGYHEGKTDLIDAGVWYTDYSVRLTRDRNGCTESASAMDIGYEWPNGGDAAWLRFNNELVSELHANRADLAAIRAVNYSPNGSTKLRTDREDGWSVVSSTDSVDIHTHIEWYRDTEGNRSSCLNRLAVIIQSAVNNVSPPNSAPTSGDDDMPNGDLPDGFGIDENNEWLSIDLAVPIPLPQVGTGSGSWGAAWLYLASTGATTLRYGCYPSGKWWDTMVDLTSAAGPLAIPDGTTQLLIARKRTSSTDTVDTIPVRWHVQYAPHTS